MFHQRIVLSPLLPHIHCQVAPSHFMRCTQPLLERAKSSLWASASKSATRNVSSGFIFHRAILLAPLLPQIHCQAAPSHFIRCTQPLLEKATRSLLASPSKSPTTNLSSGFIF